MADPAIRIVACSLVDTDTDTRLDLTANGAGWTIGELAEFIERLTGETPR